MLRGSVVWFLFAAMATGGMATEQTPRTSSLTVNVSGLRTARDTEDLQACFDLAIGHFRGTVSGFADYASAIAALDKGVAIDAESALASQQSACDAGDAAACFILGAIYHTADGIQHDLARTAALYRRACDGGEAAGCFNLGILYANGTGVGKDEARAAELYAQGCDGGAAGGCTNLGLMYALGKAVEQDDAKAVELHEKACHGGEATACANLRKLGRVPAVPKAIAADARLKTWFPGLPERPAEKDSRATPSEPELLVEGTTERRGQAAPQELGKACDERNADACMQLADMYRAGTRLARDATRAAVLYDKACSAGSPGGCNTYGVMLAFGDGVSKDPSKAIQFFEKACRAGSRRGCHNLAECYSFGLGVAQDPSKSFAFRQEACAEGLVPSCSEVLASFTSSCAAGEPGRCDEGLRWLTVTEARKPREEGKPRRDWESWFGEPTRPSVGEARERQALFAAACDHGLAAGCIGVVELGLTGMEKAQGHYELACQAGHSPACESLESYRARDARVAALVQGRAVCQAVYEGKMRKLETTVYEDPPLLVFERSSSPFGPGWELVDDKISWHPSQPSVICVEEHLERVGEYVPQELLPSPTPGTRGAAFKATLSVHVVRLSDRRTRKKTVTAMPPPRLETLSMGNMPPLVTGATGNAWAALQRWLDRDPPW